MTNQHQKIIGIASLSILGIILAIATIFMTQDTDQANNNKNTKTISSTTLTDKQDNFKATATYQGNNNWQYQITGTLPTPCHQIEDQAIVAESFPEQVTLKATIIAPTDPCIQVIEKIEKKGTFQASEQATFKLQITKNEPTSDNQLIPQGKNILSDHDYQLTTSYLGDNQWSYSLSGPDRTSCLPPIIEKRISPKPTVILDFSQEKISTCPRQEIKTHTINQNGIIESDSNTPPQLLVLH